MTSAAWLHKRKTLFFIIFVAVSFAFAIDILDLREDIHILAYPYSSLDSNITTGQACNFAYEPELFAALSSVQQKSSVEISFIHLLPYGFRAPPSRF